MSIDKEIDSSLHQLERKGLILYPTDTVWGIGCDGTDEEAVKKIFALKNRVESKSLVVLVSSVEMLKQFIKRIPTKAQLVLDTSNTPTTIIYENPIGLAKNAIASDNTIAIRIPEHDFCQILINKFRKPIVSTSANISGDPTPNSFSEISKPILEGVDYVVNLERQKITKKSSTILKLQGDDVQVIRA
ncbi:MAG: threonylcarbamoyl-AMP synthase [Flavobacteriaceae bacterium]